MQATWIVTRDDLNRAERDNIAAGLRWARRRGFDVLDPDEIAIDFHHQLVAIHVFPNGAGRHARLAADLLAVRLGRDPFGWGRSDLLKVGDARDAHRAALKAADAGDLAPLLAFARS